MIKKVCFYIFLFFCLILNIVIDSNLKNYFETLNICFNKNIILTTNLYTIICFIIALISIFIVLDILLVLFKKENENKGINFKTEDGTYGTSNWMSEDEMKNILGFNDPPGIILGKKDNNIVKLPFDSFLNKNICVFGSSGSMKSIGFLLTNLLELSKYKKSIIVTDPKAEIYRTTASYFRNIGYTVKVFNLKDMRHSDRWNPLAENENIADVQTSSSVITSNTQKKNGKDDFWPRAEENLLKAFEFYFLENISDKNTLTNVYKHIASGDISEIDKIFKSLPPEHPARMSYNIFASGSDTIKASVITGLGTRLQMFQNEDLQKLTAESDIDLSLPGKTPCIYYVITSDVDSSNDFLASLFYTFLFIKLVRYADSKETGKCDVDVFCFLDEFSNIGQIPDFNKKISTVRSRGIALLPIVQNKGQLDNRYPLGLSDEIIGNCDTKLGLGTTDDLTAGFFCDLMGVATVETSSLRKENSIEGEIEEFGQKNITTLQRNLLNKDEILRIPTNQLVAILKGNKPVLLDKMIYKEHILSSKLKDSPISEYNPNWTKNKTNENTPKPKEKQKETKPKKKLSFDNF